MMEIDIGPFIEPSQKGNFSRFCTLIVPSEDWDWMTKMMAHQTEKRYLE